LNLYLSPYDYEEQTRVQSLAGTGGRDRNAKSVDNGTPIPVKLNISRLNSAGEIVISESEIYE